MTNPQLQRGDELRVRITRMAHGGEGIGEAPDGRVAFVGGAFPGDTVVATAEKLKKSFVRARLERVDSPGPLRVSSACPAAALGAGCCDFAELDPTQELGLKVDVLLDQLRRIAGIEVDRGDVQGIELQPHRGWRTRVRLGVDAHGKAGLRKRGSNELVTSVACSQLAPGLVEGIVGENARSFTPGAEVVAVMDTAGNRHVVETRKASRGRRAEKVNKTIEGGTVTEHADGHIFEFPATAFWQAHTNAPDAYTGLARTWLRECELSGEVAWDLYGGVGLFVPALADALPAANPRVISVDFSPAATASQQPGLSGYNVEVKSAKVEAVAAQLPKPAAVVLDPPRTGAGEEVIGAVAAASPQAVVHVGCDPATFSRDAAAWKAAGFRIAKLAVVNAFPGTHHFETIALLRR